ncbi:MAG: dioxygenase [Myxococcota bacterium]
MSRHPRRDLLSEERRQFLRHAGVSVASLAGISACGPGVQFCPDPGDSCQLTPDNPEGPYYRAGAPEREDFNVLSRPGDALRFGGRVLSSDCRTPIEGAVLDVWHADGDGIYDLDTDQYGLRGRVTTSAGGEFKINTVMPGPYWFGNMPRARHVHVRLTAPGHNPLTTQLYFEGDPWIERDLQFKCGLTMLVQKQSDRLVAEYVFVLPRA